MTTNPMMAASRVVGAQSDAMRTAAANQGGMGAMGGFFGNEYGAECRRCISCKPVCYGAAASRTSSGTRLELFMRIQRKHGQVLSELRRAQARKQRQLDVFLRSG